MNSATPRIIASMVLLLLLAGAISLVWWGYSWVAGLWQGLDQPVATVTLVGVITLLLAARLAAGGPVRAERLRRNEALRHDRYEVYQKVLASGRGRQMETGDGTGRNDAEEIKRELVLCGSPRVLTAYAALLAAPANTAQQVTAWENLLLAMRRDLVQEVRPRTAQPLSAILPPPYAGHPSGARRESELTNAR